MKTVYSKDQEAAYQTLSLTIEAAPQDIFHYLGTTEGISQWFPQLAFSSEDNILRLIFDLGDGDYEKMTVKEYDEPNTIGFTWDIGYVLLFLEPDGQNTILTLEERLPFEFGNIPQDFTGWQFQAHNIKQITETGRPKGLGDAHFKEQEAKVAKELDL